MEGPTPVSALIHAATMVTAGVYMIARTHVLFDHSPFALSVVAIVGAATALFAATIASGPERHQARLAYSTISQLGYMFLGCGVAAYSAAIFHLMTHAFFKALLFLAAGSVIHAMGGEQDLRKMGGLWKKLPVTFAVTTVGVLAIAGSFPLPDSSPRMQFSMPLFCKASGKILWFVGLFTALLTSFYMFRLWYLAFMGESRGEALIIACQPWSMLVPIFILGLLSIAAAGSASDASPNFWRLRLVVRTAEAGRAKLELILSVAAVGVAILGWVVAYLFYKQGSERPDELAAAFPRAYKLLANKYYVDEFYDATVVKPLLLTSQYLLGGLVDKGILGGAAWLLGGTGKILPERSCSNGSRAISALMPHGWRRARRQCCSLCGSLVDGAGQSNGFSFWRGGALENECDQQFDSHLDPPNPAGRSGPGGAGPRSRQAAQLDRADDRARQFWSYAASAGALCSWPWRFPVCNQHTVDREPRDLYHVGVDGLSLWLVVLTGLLAPIGVIASWNVITERRKIFFVLFLLQQTAMFGVFISLD